MASPIPAPKRLRMDTSFTEPPPDDDAADTEPDDDAADTEPDDSDADTVRASTPPGSRASTTDASTAGSEAGNSPCFSLLEPPGVASDPDCVYTVLLDYYDPMATPPNSGSNPLAAFDTLEEANAHALDYPRRMEWLDGDEHLREIMFYNWYHEHYDARTGCVDIKCVFSDVEYGSASIRVVATRFDAESPDITSTREAWCVLDLNGLVDVFQSRVGAEGKLRRVLAEKEGRVLVDTERDWFIVEKGRPDEKLFWMMRWTVGP